MEKKVSIVINYRNDQYFDDCLNRISKSINMNLYFLEKIGMRSLVDFNIVDWGSKNPLHENVEIFSDFKENVKFFFVDKSITEAHSVDHANGFHLDKSPNVGFRMSKGEFIIQSGADQIISRSGWFNLLNIINNKQNFSINIDNTLFYIPRKFIDLDFYYKDPSFEVFERYLNYSNFSAIKYKQPTFYVGGGYGLMANRKIIESLNGHTEVNIPGSANDLDFNTRIKKMGLDQVDCSSFGINFFKFPSKPNSNRNSLLYKTKKTRFYPNLSDTTKPNDENWGLKQENILTMSPQKITNKLEEINKHNFFLEKNNLKPLTIFEQLGHLSKFEKISYNLSEWRLIFQISKIIKSSKIFSLIEFGYDNSDRLNVVGKEFKSLEIISFDIECLIGNNNYINRLLRIQNSLSNNRHGKFVPLNSNNFEEFSKWVDKAKFQDYANIYLVNISSIRDEIVLKKIELQIKESKDYISFVILYDPLKSKKNLQPNINEYFKSILIDKKIKIFINKNINDDNKYSKKIIFKFKLIKLFCLIFLYSAYSSYIKITSTLKKIHKVIFKFKY